MIISYMNYNFTMCAMNCPEARVPPVIVLVNRNVSVVSVVVTTA